MKSFPLSQLRKILIATAVALSGTASVQASILFSDQFLTTGDSGGYTAGGNLKGQQPGPDAGWSGSWNGDSTGLITIGATNLAMSGLPNEGGAISVSAVGANSAKSVYHLFGTPAGQATVWFSTLFAPTASSFGTDSQLMAGFLSGYVGSASSWTNTQLQGFSLGVMNSGKLTVQYQTNAANAATAGAFETASSSLSLATGTTYLLIAKLDVNTGGNDILNVWIKTSAPTSEASLGAADLSITADLLTDSSKFSTLNLWLARGSTGFSDAGRFDALRGGTTFNDVMGIPEPSSLALLLGASVVFAGLMSRRK